MSSDVDRILRVIDRDCDQIRADLTRLANALDSGLGEPFPTEMTPAQADRLAASLGRVGEFGGVILARDLSRTAAREGGA
jgi:hypothetical protein